MGCGGTATADVTVTVEEAPPTVIISASPANIVLGDSTPLAWDSKKVTGVHIDNSIGPVTLTGSQSVTPTYTITGSGAEGPEFSKPRAYFLLPPVNG